MIGCHRSEAIDMCTFSVYEPEIYLYYSSGADQRILIWDIGSAAQVCELKGHSDSVYQLVFSRDGSILASGGLDNCVKLWDASGFDGDGKIAEPQKWYGIHHTHN